MAVIRKFLFDTDFDDSSEAALKRALAPKVVEQPVVEEPPPPPPPPMFSEEQVEAVRQQAYEIGFAAGRGEAEATQAHQLTAAMQTIAAVLRGIGDTQIQQAETNHRDAVRIALAVAERVLPTLAARNAM